MSLKEVWYTCPQCYKAFRLKGSKLRVWLQTKKKNKNKKGPFCDHVCSGKFNVKKARKAKKIKEKTK